MPFIKPTAKHIPLGPHSQHAGFVHRSWPVGEIQRMRKLSMHDHTFEEYRDLKIARFVQFSLSHEVVESCRNWKPTTPSSICKSSLIKSANFNILRVVVPFNAYICRGMHAVKVKIQESLDILLRGVMSRVQFEICYCNSGQPLHIALRKVNET